MKSYAKVAMAAALCGALAAGGMLAASGNVAAAEKKYDPGASDTEIKIGNTMPYSGPLSAFGLIGRTISAYLDKVNAEGGINGRKIKFISYDDSYSPPKTVEETRKLVEDDGVLLIFQSAGTASNTAIHKYLNARKVPQLFVASSAAKWGDPDHFPWTMGWSPSSQSEGRIFAQYLIANHPDGKIGILYPNDDSGRDYVKGLKDGLAGKLAIVSEQSYEASDPTVDTQIIKLSTSGATIFFDAASAKFASLAIRKVNEIGWKPLHLLVSSSSSVGSVLKPAGLDKAKAIVTAYYLKDPTDPAWKDDADYKQWSAFIDKYFPSGDRTSNMTVYGYATAQTLVEVLKRCGDDLTRENVMKQAANLKNLHVGMLLPGIVVDTSPTDFYPVKQMQMMRFNGERWELFGPVLNGALGGT